MLDLAFRDLSFPRLGRRRGGGSPDTTPPEITSLSYSEGLASATVSEAGTIWWLISASGSAMTGAAIKAAVQAASPTLFGSFTVSVGVNDQAIDTSGLAPGTWYLHAAPEDAAGNVAVYGDVVSFSVAAPGWNLLGASYESKSYAFSQDSNATGVFISPDGLRMYMVGGTTDDLYQYALSTAWDVSTATYIRSFTTIPDTQVVGVFFRPDGTRCYVVGNANNSIYEFNLATAWDISTCSAGGTLAIGGRESAPMGVWLRDDGLRMYTVGLGGDTVDEYDLGTAWLLSTAVYSREKAVSAQDANPTGVFFRADGLAMFVSGQAGAIHEYALSTAWDVTTATFTRSYSVATQSAAPGDVFFKSDGAKFYVTDGTTSTVYQYEAV